MLKYSKISSKLYDIVVQFGIKDIKTINVGSEPKWNSPRLKTIGCSDGSLEKSSPEELLPRIIGYEAWDSTFVKVREIQLLGELIEIAHESVLTQGGITSISQGWDFENKQEQEDEARKQAFADAKRKASLYASEAGITLGRFSNISEYQYFSGYNPAEVFQKARNVMLTSVPLEQGEQTVIFTVDTVWLTE